MRLSILQLRNELGLSVAEFVKKFGFDARVLAKWESGEESTPDYILDMVEAVVTNEKSKVPENNAKYKRQVKRTHKSLIGMKFNQLTVVGPAEDYVNPSGQRYIQWKCRCDCGNYIVKRGTALTSGSAKSCGCARSTSNQNKGLIDLTGKTFGAWTVIKRAEDVIDPRGRHVPMWLCECQCGTRKTVAGSSLRNGDSKSCGCLKIAHLRVDRDLSGQRFGRLLVKERAADEIRYNRNNKMWLCECDCGNETCVREADLLNNSVNSCGCMGRSMNEVFFRELLDEFEIPYTTEKTYPDLKGDSGRALRFDICMDMDGDVLVELNGIQHYENTDYFGSGDVFEYQHKLDNRKRDYVKSHNLKLYEIDCSNRPSKYGLRLELLKILTDLQNQGVDCSKYLEHSTSCDYSDLDIELKPNPTIIGFTGTWANIVKIVKQYQFYVIYNRELNMWNENSEFRGIPVRSYIFENRLKHLHKTPAELTDSEILRGFTISGVIKGYTAFDSSLMDKVIKKYNIKSVYDPCAGWGERMLCCHTNKVKYAGVDINEALEDGYTRMISDLNINAEFIVGDSSEVKASSEYDAVITCPPYWNIEKYTDKGAENLSYDEFLVWWDKVVKNSVSDTTKYFCFQINQRFSGDMIDIVKKNGFELVEEFVYSNNKSSHFTRKNGDNTKKEHDTMYVFKKK